MRCIPTLVLLPKHDAERLRAIELLRMRLLREGTPEHVLERWNYLGSTPYRAGDGAIVYAHGFAHEDGTEVLGVPASAGWWPSGQPTGRRRSTPRRGSLRLVMAPASSPMTASPERSVGRP